ncbi:glutaredoxin family protein [Haloferax sp. S1W]|uniref:glutaredoxin family protein n=1 Tax=Haloferax sp. S1W TaxID=3377110 RepID=UPI0037CB18F7
MTFQPESFDPDEVDARVEEAIENNHVVLFMKGNRLMPQCGYSAKALELISTYVDEFETIDVLPALPHYREALNEHSGWETIPQTFVDGEFIGGSDILEELEERGELESTLDGTN